VSIKGRAYSEAHEIGEKHDVARVDVHAVLLHGVLDFVHDRHARGFNAQRLTDHPPNHTIARQ
jgi:hypothetical protein